MATAYSGTDVRVSEDGRVWVMMPAGSVGKAAQWKQVPLEEVLLDADFPNELLTRRAGHSIRDLQVDCRAMSHNLGIPRRDVRRVREIWKSPRVLRSEQLAIDFEQRELAQRDGGSGGRMLVWPFAAFTKLTVDPSPRLLVKVPFSWSSGYILLGDFPVPPTQLAQDLRLPLDAQP